MAFVTQLRDELCKDIPDNPQELHALLYGFLLFSHRFAPDEISFSTRHEPTARLFAEAVALHCGISAKITFKERVRGTIYKVQIEKSSERKLLMEKFSHAPKEPHLRINRSNFEDENGIPYFLRGAFLACGRMTDPEKDYHCEFSVNFMNLSRDLSTLIGEVLDQPKTVLRRGAYVIYYKESENIEDILTYIGAPMAALELMNIKIMKDIKNRVNRRINCESANMDKTINASFEQMEDIHYIFEHRDKSILPEELLELAEMRIENPEMSLRELAEALHPPISRSGVNHRLKHLSRIAEEIRREDHQEK